MQAQTVPGRTWCIVAVPMREFQDQCMGGLLLSLPGTPVRSHFRALSGTYHGVPTHQQHSGPCPSGGTNWQQHPHLAIELLYALDSHLSLVRDPSLFQASRARSASSSSSLGPGREMRVSTVLPAPSALAFSSLWFQLPPLPSSVFEGSLVSSGVVRSSWSS